MGILVADAFRATRPIFCGVLVDEYLPPVLHCCAGGMPLTALSLLDFNAQFNGADKRGRTALHYAYERALPKVVDALLNLGADAGATDHAGLLPHDYIGD